MMAIWLGILLMMSQMPVAALAAQFPSSSLELVGLVEEQALPTLDEEGHA